MMAGFYSGTDLSDKTFYGIRYDSTSGKLEVDVINDGTTEVRLPADSRLDPITYSNDYVNYVWSQDSLEFSINNNGHLRLKML
jgi:hypothetical protein